VRSNIEALPARPRRSTATLQRAQPCWPHMHHRAVGQRRTGSGMAAQWVLRLHVRGSGGLLRGVAGCEFKASGKASIGLMSVGQSVSHSVSPSHNPTRCASSLARSSCCCPRGGLPAAWQTLYPWPSHAAPSTVIPDTIMLLRCKTSSIQGRDQRRCSELMLCAPLELRRAHGSCLLQVGAALSVLYTFSAPTIFCRIGQTYVNPQRLNVKSVVRCLLKQPLGGRHSVDASGSACHVSRWPARGGDAAVGLLQSAP